MNRVQAADVTTVEEAKGFGAEFAFIHHLNDLEACKQATTWFENGEGYPERKYDALESFLKRHFGLI
jgi:hypothetical protein